MKNEESENCLHFKETVQEKQGSYHRSRVELGDDVVEEGGEVGGARLELLDAVKAVTLAV